MELLNLVYLKVGLICGSPEPGLPEARIDMRIS